MMCYKSCKGCGLPFLQTYGQQVYCEDCRRCKKFADNVEVNRKPTGKTLNEILADLRAYNKKHNCCLSYGSYVSKLEHGKLKD